ncbi:MAG TPA: cobyric acid synthase [Methanomassiliicoccales archaeon]
MRNFVEKIAEELAAGDIGTNSSCDWYHCHFKGQNCSFCFCPFYPCMDGDLGEMVKGKKGPVWSCQECFWMHRHDVAADFLKEMGGRTYDQVSQEELTEIKARLESRHLKKAKRLMVMGATSGAGKSLMCTAFCRIFSNMGYTVVPFKAQNMSLNSVVTDDGEEIARAQELQARGARIKPNSHMNPILLKPKGDSVSQVIVEGRPYRDMDVKQYYGEFTDIEGVEIVRRNIGLLSKTSDLIVIEGAGSPAEINMSEHDIVNMRTAEIAEASCILVVNIEWGGAFAYMYGTLMLLPEEQRRMFKGIIVTNMHGSAESLAEGFEEIERLTGVPVLGVVPHIDLDLPDEDSMFLGDRRKEGSIVVGVVRLPRISNFTDFDALSLEPGVVVRFLDDASEVNECAALIIPGTKNTIDDLTWMREKGFDAAICSVRGKVPILGVCGGFQMLGTELRDEQGLEGKESGTTEGLGLLDVVTSFDSYDKRTVQVTGLIVGQENLGPVRGYEIHMGMTDRGLSPPLFDIEDFAGKHSDGAVSADGMVMGSYLHGSFDLPAFRRFFLSKACRSDTEVKDDSPAKDYDASVDESIERIAAALKGSLDMGKVYRMLGLGEGK